MNIKIGRLIRVTRPESRILPSELLVKTRRLLVGDPTTNGSQPAFKVQSTYFPGRAFLRHNLAEVVGRACWHVCQLLP